MRLMIAHWALAIGIYTVYNYIYIYIFIYIIIIIIAERLIAQGS